MAAAGTGPFSGQVAVVTGGAQGIGFGVAAHLGSLGARVALFDMQADKLAEAAAALASRGVETMTLEVKDEHRELTSGAPQSLTVLVEVPVGDLGKLRARIALAGERIAITTWSETPELRRLIASNIGQLDAALLAQGFDVAPSVVREINAPKAVHAGYQPLIDTQV